MIGRYIGDRMSSHCILLLLAVCLALLYQNIEAAPLEDDSVSPPTFIGLPPPLVKYRGAEYCDERVCLRVRVFVSPTAYLPNCTSDLHQFCACYLWPWLDPPLMALRYVIYFRF